jgi:hypothetical protein
MAVSEKEQEDKAKRDRSPSYPMIPLGVAVSRLAALDEYFKRHPAPFKQLGLAWDMKPSSSQASSTAAALKSFGLVDYQGAATDLKVVLSEEGRTYLRAQQDEIKRGVLRRVALNPKAIAKYWKEWGAVRPPNPVCLDELVLKAKFTQAGAENFLKVYDATIAAAGLRDSDKVGSKDDPQPSHEPDDEVSAEVGDLIQWNSSGVLQFPQPKRVRAVQQHDGMDWVFVDGSDTGIPMSEVTVEQKGFSGGKPPVFAEQVRTLATEREWLRGPLSKDTSYRLIVTGDLGPKDIGKLIKLLQAQKAVLDDTDEEGSVD